MLNYCLGEVPMNQSELSCFIETNQHIHCRNDDRYTYFRNTSLPFYANNPDSCTRIDNAVVSQLNEAELLQEINRGLEVEHITRITGYYTKVSQWNKGKLGELKDRLRTPIE
jgi:anaerobic ribonucleoside-triphosphate reductase